MPSVGVFELGEELTRGEAGAVHRGTDPRDGRDVRVLLLPASAGGKLARRVTREVEALSRLEHPQIVRVLGGGEAADGVVHLVHEAVEGPTLSEEIARGPQDPRWAAAVVAGLARVVQSVHDAGIVHGDLSPERVVLSDSGPRLGGFDVSRELVQGPEALRIKGRFLGSTGYLSPEQAQADRDEVGPRTDVHGLGAILFALLTSRPPSPARTLIEAVDGLHAPVPPPSTWSEAVDAELDLITSRCLAKNPNQRFASAAELAAALDEWLKRPADDATGDRARARAQVRGLVSWLLVLLALLPAGWGVGHWRKARAIDLVLEVEAEAVEAAASGRARSNRARGMIPFDPALAARAADALCLELPADPNGWSAAANAHLAGADLPQAKSCFERALALAPQRLEDQLLLGALQLGMSEAVDALASARAALELAPLRAAALSLGARAALAKGDAEASEALALTWVGSHPRDAQGWEVLVRARLARDDLEGALGAATRLRLVEPELGQALWDEINGGRD